MKQNFLSNSIKIKTTEKEFLKSTFLVLSGVVFLSIMSQLIIPLYFTPVPISLGSFGVILMALLYGRKLGTATVLSYVAAGSLGAPIFAGFKAGSLFSPTGGYILGYIAATVILGFLSTFPKDEKAKEYYKKIGKELFEKLKKNKFIKGGQ